MEQPKEHTGVSMAKIAAPIKLTNEDIPAEQRQLASKVGESLNGFMEETFYAFNKRINITDNLNQELKTIKATMVDDGFGNQVLRDTVKIKSNLTSKVQGIQVIRAFGEAYTNSLPFIYFTETDKIVTINHIVGLPNDKEFSLVLVLIGD